MRRRIEKRMIRKALIGILAGMLTLAMGLTLPTSVYSQAPPHPKIPLKGVDGSPLTIDSKIPYSPKRTCGACHPYDQITNGYHFQQGRTDGRGKIVISDTFDPKSPWNLSSGMFGKHRLASADSSQLARKVNSNPSEIDKSSFYFAQHCGPCHPGGGSAEYDRKGNLYFNEETRKIGFEFSEGSSLFDGDYTPYSTGDITYGVPWDESGVSEADCLICHLKGYLWSERGATLRGKHFKYGPTVGAGWALLKLSQEEEGDPRAEEVTVDYTKKEVADFENLSLQIVRKPLDENCWACHATSDGWKRGRQWSPETDVHNAKGLGCVTCHPGDIEHNFAKGDTIQETVRDDLDSTMPSCEDCHYKGKDRQAPQYRHPFSPRHMKRIACQTCHIPFQTAPADLVYDLASTGSPLIINTSRFLSGSHDSKAPSAGIDPNAWYPQLRDFKGRIVPVKSLVIFYWGDFDEKTQAVQPIFLWKVRGIKKPALKDGNGDGIPEVNSLAEIKAWLIALKANDSFGNPVAKQPVLVKGGFLYRLNKKGEVEKIRHEQAELHDFSLSHNIQSGQNVIGAGGCKDCHSKNSPFFLRRILVDPIDEAGKPVYREAWERLGIGKARLDESLLEQ